MKIQHSAWLLASLLCLSTSAALAADAPPAAPASAPASIPSPDFSTPETALRTYLYARFSKEANAVRDCVDIPAANAANVNAMLDMITSGDTLQQTATKRFGKANAFNPDPNGDLAGQLAALAKLKIVITGDHATAQQTTAGGSTWHLTKTPGGWKIDGPSLVNPNNLPAEKLADRLSMIKKVTALNHDLITAIEANKFINATDARNDYSLRLAPILAAAPTATAPATTTKP